MHILGIILLIVGVLITLGGFGSGGSGFVQIIIGAVTSFFGSQLYTKNKPGQLASQNSTASKSKFELSDEMIMRLANRLNNKLSVEDLVQQTSLTRDQAKARLEKLHQQGICQINLDNVEESGKIYYNFNN